MRFWPSLTCTNDRPEVLELRLPPQQAARVRAALEELGRPPELTGTRDVLREAVLVAIDELGEEINAHCTRLLREGSGSIAELRVALADLDVLLGSLAEMDQPSGL